MKGTIDDCSCNVDTVDYYNNVKLYPRLKSLLTKDYFRYYKVNLKKKCPFWPDDHKCAMKFCHVEMCDQKDIPEGLKGETAPVYKVSHFFFYCLPIQKIYSNIPIMKELRVSVLALTRCTNSDVPVAWSNFFFQFT